MIAAQTFAFAFSNSFFKLSARVFEEIFDSELGFQLRYLDGKLILTNTFLMTCSHSPQAGLGRGGVWNWNSRKEVIWNSVRVLRHNVKVGTAGTCKIFVLTTTLNSFMPVAWSKKPKTQLKFYAIFKNQQDQVALRKVCKNRDASLRWTDGITNLTAALSSSIEAFDGTLC